MQPYMNFMWYRSIQLSKRWYAYFFLYIKNRIKNLYKNDLNILNMYNIIRTTYVSQRIIYKFNRYFLEDLDIYLKIFKNGNEEDVYFIINSILSIDDSYLI